MRDKICTDRWTQYIEPGVLWSSGFDEFGRTAYKRSLWIPEYYV